MIVRGRELHLHPRRGGVTHWAYGMLNGALYGIAAESLGQPRTWYGLPFGAAVWAVDYAVLPAAGLYKPIQDYDRPNPGQGPQRPPRLRDHRRRSAAPITLDQASA